MGLGGGMWGWDPTLHPFLQDASQSEPCLPSICPWGRGGGTSLCPPTNNLKDPPPNPLPIIERGGGSHWAGAAPWGSAPLHCKVGGGVDKGLMGGGGVAAHSPPSTTRGSRRMMRAKGRLPPMAALCPTLLST